MLSNSHKILVVDDEMLWLELIELHLRDSGYKIVTASHGQQALDILHADPCGFDLVILDKFMDGLDGMDVLRQIKADPNLKVLPVILETADTAPEKILEGIRAGAYYYLTKPFSAEQLRAVIQNALNQHHGVQLARKELLNMKDTLHLAEEIIFAFRSREQARTIVALLSSACLLTMVQEMGLFELMLNAVEHGNLGIGYDEKTQLISENRLDQEIDRRLQLHEYAEKTAIVKFRRCGRSLIFSISDEGKGFDWRPYLDMQIERINDNHGRGIAMANSLAFTHLSYRGIGNSVEATIVLHE
ncbi:MULTISPECIES: response regulator [Methylomonas]|uniref:Response regulatory domain-containing protein n=2 Tax=Methylomonas TaxID=416 RepID=A0A140E3P7_9GAMM|nr:MULTISPECIES: response regulator [Methylomonas]AMK75021.1 hypothetical protein JT25_000730 [Methylomonas denitrificans]OAI02517.1 hypothetical protein A1342_01720 [Methylomonas methanica]TCV83165.1 histidine kinase-like protein [Methylomonas methanica]